MNQQELLVGALVGIDDTQHSSGTATAPALGVDVGGTTINITAGRWEFDVTVSMSGTAETLVRNLKLMLGTSQIQATLLSVPGTNTYRFRMNITNAMLTAGGATGSPLTAALKLQAVANATAGAIYTAALRATRIGG